MPSEVFRPGLLEGQVAIVSGGGSGFGRATALELAALGARVVVCGRRDEPLRETAALAEGGLVEAHPCDIREEDQVAGLVDGVLERHGGIDLLVNNAGGQYLTPAEDITPKGFRTVMRLNVEGTWLMTHAVVTKAMIPSGRGGKVVSVTHLPPQRAAGHGALVGRARRRREPDEGALDRVGALRDPSGRAGRRPVRHRHLREQVPQADRRGRGVHGAARAARPGRGDRVDGRSPGLPGWRLRIGRRAHDRRRARQLVRHLAAWRRGR